MDDQIRRLSEEEVLIKYSGLVKKIALKMIVKLPSNIQLEDLLQVGMIALLEARKNYDNSKGASFTTYAGIRIKGSMIDEVRREDWLPRSSHRATKILGQIQDFMAQHNKKDVTASDICSALNISHDEYQKICNLKNNYKIYYFDDIGVNAESLISSNVDKDITENVEGKLLRVAIKNNIDKLPDKERMVLNLYYDSDLSLKQIGEIMALTESRICQLHSQAMQNLAKNMKEWK